MSEPNTTSPSALREQSIDESIESIDSVKSTIEQFKEGFKILYTNYLQNVESEKKLTVPFESLRKADSLYNKLLESVDKFTKALTTDYLTIRSTIIYELKIVSNLSGHLYNQLNIRFVEEFIAKMNELNHSELKEIFALNIIELTPCNNEPTIESMDTEPIDSNSNQGGSKRRRDDDDGTNDEVVANKRQKKRMSYFLPLNSSITAEDLRTNVVIIGDYSAERINRLLHNAMMTWNIFQDMDEDSFIKQESFGDFCDQFLYLLPIKRIRLNKIDQILKIFRQVKQLDDKFTKNNLKSLDEVLLMNNPQMMEIKREYLTKRKQITDLFYYYLYYLMDNWLSKKMPNCSESTVNELTLLTDDVNETQIVLFMDEKVLSQLKNQVESVREI
ncbi:hypothetical protein KQX54_018954 [Cotesia glomerata]|uniref:Uncharacterized protein n=1 Tax=Cotesia glomerata TaxID=32391 RepID=A0AAV7IUY0_COTGL|nr:hypothetical protein KQX54_018954 [Cotesia glomerata]